MLVAFQKLENRRGIICVVLRCVWVGETYLVLILSHYFPQDRTEVEEQDGVGSEVLASWKTVLTMLASMRRPEGLHEVQSKIRRSFIGGTSL